MKSVDKYLLLTVFVMMLGSIYAAFVYAPTERVMGDVQRIFYFHVASAWTGLLAFFGVFLGGGLYLWKKQVKWDHFAYASAELGVFFALIVLITGPIWARPVWNVWWTWDPRLTSTFVLWLIFTAYLMLRSALKNHPSIRTYAAVYGIIGFMDVPIVWMSIRWWRTIHPRVFSAERIDMDPRMWHAVLFCFATFIVLSTLLLRMRMRIENTREQVFILQEHLQEG